MEPSEQTKFVVATYDEIRLRFGLGGTDQARMKAKRRKWPAEPGNHPGAVTRIRVPQEDWDAAQAEPRQVRSPRIDPPVPQEQSRNLKPLEDAIAIFREERQRLSEVVSRHRQELDATMAKIAEQRIREAAIEAKLEAAEAKRIQAELQAAVFRAKVEAAEAALVEARRPWWKRLIGQP